MIIAITGLGKREWSLHYDNDNYDKCEMRQNILYIRAYYMAYNETSNT